MATMSFVFAPAVFCGEQNLQLESQDRPVVPKYLNLVCIRTIIQHIVTVSKYGHSALNIRRAYSTYILRYT